MPEGKQQTTPAKAVNSLSNESNRDERLQELRKSIKTKSVTMATGERKNPDTTYDLPVDVTHVEEQQENSADKARSTLVDIALCVALVTTICTLVFFLIVFTQIFDMMASRKEYKALVSLTESAKSEVSPLNEFDAKKREVNSEYLCWITIEDTKIDYPVVRTDDNEKYLHTSFFGKENVYGTLFMDYRCVGKYVPHIIIYGHNAKSGDMFGVLRKFLDEKYLAEHPIITLKINGHIVEYEIFAARKTNVNDYAYNLDFRNPASFREFAEVCGAPQDTTQIITLSTCVSGQDKDERIVVQGASRQTLD